MYQPAQGNIGNWDFNSLFNYGSDYSQDFGAQRVMKLYEKMQQGISPETPEELNQMQRLQEAMVSNRQEQDPYEALQQYGSNNAPITSGGYI